MQAASQLSDWNRSAARAGHGELSFRRISRDPDTLLKQIMNGASRYKALRSEIPEKEEVTGIAVLDHVKNKVIGIAGQIGTSETIAGEYVDTPAPDLASTIRLAESMGMVVSFSVSVSYPDSDT